MKYSKYNVVIIGSGLAGLYLANKLGHENSFRDGILLITKDELYSGSTSLAQGGIVSVVPEFNMSDSVELHIKDTLAAGCGINNINAVKFVSENSYIAIQELIAMGVEFDRDNNNKLDFTKEGAHSVARILHAKGDSTGSVIEKVLCDNVINNQNIDIYSHTIALELLGDKTGTVRGLVVYNSESAMFEAIYSNNIVIATGGIGQLYKNTTNPHTSTADGIALAMEAGAEVENMEFVQFHPTGLYCKNTDVVPLVSESVRGEGAKLVNINGEYFAKKYHSNAELAPRDVVARAIYSEMKNTNSDYVNLDISQIGIENFKLRFPTITKSCLDNNIDISSGLIPVAPVQHYFMGGIKTDLNSKTSVDNLYAIGECSMTGLHGANRLASNSLLECAVFAHNLSEYIVKNSIEPPNIFDEKINKTIMKYTDINLSFDDMNVIDELFNKLKNIMSDNVSIIRTEAKLRHALSEIELIDNEFKQLGNSFNQRKYELNNALIVAKSVIQSALDNKNSIGAHYRLDCDNVFVKENANNKGSMINEKLLA